MSDTPRVAEKQVVTLHYSLTVDGELQETSRREGGAPFDYLHGANNIVPGLEEALTDKPVGETVKVTVPPAKGYGERNDEMVQAVPRANFPDDFDAKVGSVFHAQTEDGQVLQGFIADLPDDKMVVVDFNHPLAGKTLDFEVEVMGVRDANKEELEHGHPHGPNGHQH